MFAKIPGRVEHRYCFFSGRQSKLSTEYSVSVFEVTNTAQLVFFIMSQFFPKNQEINSQSGSPGPRTDRCSAASIRLLKQSVKIIIWTIFQRPISLLQ